MDHVKVDQDKAVGRCPVYVRDTLDRKAIQMSVGRNDPCPCGSGKKYKYCCLPKEREAERAARAEQQAHRSATDLSPGGLPCAEELDEAFSPEPTPPAAVDPLVEAANARWEEFEGEGYEGRITLFLKTLGEPALMDSEMAFEMLNTLYGRCIERGENERFFDLLDRLQEVLPDVYAHDAQYYLAWRINQALVSNQVETLRDLVREMTATAAKDIDTFDNVLDQLAYYGHLPALVEATQMAWPSVKESDNIVTWGISEFARRSMDYAIFHYLEANGTPRADDPALTERLAFFGDFNPGMLARYLALITGQLRPDWRMEDLQLAKRPDPDDAWFFDEEEEEEAEEPDPARQNLYELTIEFLGYLRREEDVPYTKGELGRENLHRYLLKRHAGELEPVDPPLGAPRGRRRRKRRARKPVHPLCPDRSTLHRFLNQMLYFLNPQKYPATATLELTPAWLRFLESRQLIDAEQHAQTMQGLRGLDTELRKVWENYPEDPGLREGLDGWRDT
jgi:hypothetical protein